MVRPSCSAREGDDDLVRMSGDLLVCLLNERLKCSDKDVLSRVRDALDKSECVMGARVWDDEHMSDTVRMMIDSGASTHMTNSRAALERGTIGAGDVSVMGVGGTTTHITQMGSVSLVVGDREHVLTDVLLCEGIQLCAGPVYEPQVLMLGMLM